ncbi:TPA: competence type IV pilus minor pilin ComGG [Streptococcus suis]
MLLRKKVKGGVLLYALLMLAIFSLLLQFYLNRQAAHQTNLLAQREASQAYIMAQLVKEGVLEEQPATRQTEEEGTSTNTDEATGPRESSPQSPPVRLTGSVQFVQGQATYSQTTGYLQVQVHLTTGREFSYTFPIPSQN